MYDGDGEVVLATDDVEVGEHDEHKVVVGFNEAGPSRNVLPNQIGTSMASISISMRWVCLPSVESYTLDSILILTIKYKIINLIHQL